MGLADRDYMKAKTWQREQRDRLAAWQWRTWRRDRTARGRRRRLASAVAAAILMLAAGAVGYAAGAEIGPFAPSPVVVWGGKEFSSKAQFEQWLTGRGGSYTKWARKHPTAAARLERHP
jgi:hypothetical protein